MNIQEQDSLLSTYQQSLPDLIHQAHSIHRMHHDCGRLDVLGAFSIKTGGCPEDCKYCPQSAHYKTGILKTPLVHIDTVLHAARKALQLGITHFCLGAAYGKVPKGDSFKNILNIVQAVHSLGIEVCCSLGTIDNEQAKSLKQASCSIYNHNLDTSPRFYPHIIQTRTFEERYSTLEVINKSGLALSCGGIIGMGESIQDRLDLLYILSQLNPHPAFIPINILYPCAGTPLEKQTPICSFEYIRIVAMCRILMPKSKIVIGAGRSFLSPEAQSLCIQAGINGIYIGEKILTTPTPQVESDYDLVRKLSMQSSLSCVYS